MAPRKVPGGIAGDGLELWNQLQQSLEFTMTEQQIAVDLCRTVSLCELLSRELDALGPVIDGQRGLKVNPIAAELRQQRLTAARLAASLKIPDPDTGMCAGHRGGVRGVYVRGAK